MDIGDARGWYIFHSPKSIPCIALCLTLVIICCGPGDCSLTDANGVLQAAVDLFEIASKRDVRPATVISKYAFPCGFSCWYSSY